MDALGAEIGRWAIAQGVFAIIAFVLAWRLWQRETEISAINAARLTEAKEAIKALTESTITLRQVAEAQDNAAEANRDLAEAVRLHMASQQRL